MEDFTQSLAKVADSINKKRRQEILKVYSNTNIFKQINQLRDEKTYSKGGKAMRKVATIPMEVDIFFSRVYGPDYYKDPDFFTKKHAEWGVNADAGAAWEDYEETNKNIKDMFIRSQDA